MNQSSSETAPQPAAKKPTLKLKFLSHGTLETKDIDFARKFYEEFMGFEVVRTSKISLWIRLVGNHISAVVQGVEGKKTEMPFLNHNGADIETADDLYDCHHPAF